MISSLVCRFTVKTIVFSLCLLSVSCSRQDIRPIVESDTPLDTMLRVAQDSLATNPVYSRKMLVEAEDYVTDSVSRLELLNQWSKYYILVGSIDSSERYTRMILDYYHACETTSARDSNLMLSALNNTAVMRSMLHQTDSALLYYLQAVAFVSQNDNRYHLPNLYLNIADAYQHQSNYPAAIDFFLKALAIVEADTSEAGHGIRFAGYTGMAQAYIFGMEDYLQAEHYLMEAERLVEGRTISEQFSYFVTFGNMYFIMKRYDEAIIWDQKALSIAEKVNSPYHLAFCKANLGSVYLMMNQLDRAQACLDESYDYFLIDRSESMLQYLRAYKAKLALKKGQYAVAGQWLKGNMDNRYVEPTIRLEYLEAAKDYFTATGAFEMALKTEKQERQLNDSIRSVYVKNTVVDLERRYSRDTTLLKKDFLIQAGVKKISYLEKMTLAWSMVAFIALTALVLFYLSRKKTLELQRVKQTEMVNKLRLQGLRNSLSPHFIFNALNREVLTAEEKERQATLMALVKLLRRTLDVAERVGIPLADELDFVSNYLKVEQKRFIQPLLVDINVAEGIDCEMVMVLSMMVQIPVENVIKHAFEPDTVDKKLTITISKGQDQALLLVVADNGKGVDLSMDASKKGSGLGLRVLEQSIKWLNTKNQQKMTMAIQNRSEDSGTEVRISIPRGYTFDI